MKRPRVRQRSTVPVHRPAGRKAAAPRAKRAALPLPPRPDPPRPARRSPPLRPPARKVAHIIDDSDRSLVDVLDSLLNQGVVLNADVVLALANVDLVYLRLSALLCAADRILPRRG